MMKCVFFDRDGIVNYPPEPGGYVTNVNEFRVMPAFLESLRLVCEAGYLAIIITNQQGVGKGLYSEGDLHKIHQKLLEIVHEQDLELKDIYYCPHLAEEQCLCRKPLPGMILSAADKWGIDLTNSWMVGDSFRDIDAGVGAGCRTVYVGDAVCGKASYSLCGMSYLPDLLGRILI